MPALILQDILNVKSQKETKNAEEDVRMFSYRWICRAIFILPLNISSYWRLAVVSHFSVFCWRQLLICKAAYIPFHIFSQACVTFPTHPVAGCNSVLLLGPEGWVYWPGAAWQGWFQSMGTVSWMQGLPVALSSVDGSGAILCYTDTLPSAADCANFVLALVLCLNAVLVIRGDFNSHKKLPSFEPIFVISAW